jgi:tetratricopeptide (TPR) repeat protein
MKRNYYAITAILILGLIGLATLVTSLRDKNADDSPLSTETKPAASHTLKLAEQYEMQGEFAAALDLYTQLSKTQTRSAELRFKVAACQTALGNKKDAASTLAGLLEMDSASAELVTRARAALSELLLPQLSEDLKKDFKQALALISAAEELHKQQAEEVESRLEKKLFAQPLRRALILLETLLRQVDYAPAHVALGIAHEHLRNYAKAAAGYRKFLDFGSKNGLPEMEQQSQIRQRLLICATAYQHEVELKIQEAKDRLTATIKERNEAASAAKQMSDLRATLEVDSTVAVAAHNAYYNQQCYPALKQYRDFENLVERFVQHQRAAGFDMPWPKEGLHAKWCELQMPEHELNLKRLWDSLDHLVTQGKDLDLQLQEAPSKIAALEARIGICRADLARLEVELIASEELLKR